MVLVVYFANCLALFAQNLDSAKKAGAQDAMPILIPIRPEQSKQSGERPSKQDPETPLQNDPFAKATMILDKSKYNAATMEFRRLVDENSDFKKTYEYAFLMLKAAKAMNDTEEIEHWTRILLMRIGKTEYKALEWLFSQYDDDGKRKVIDTITQWSPEQIRFVDDFVHGTYYEKQRSALANVVALEISSGDKLRNLLFWWNLTTILSGIGAVIIVTVVSNLIGSSPNRVGKNRVRNGVFSTEKGLF